MAEKTIGVGIIASGFVADIHEASFAQVQGARLAAVPHRGWKTLRPFMEAPGRPVISG